MNPKPVIAAIAGVTLLATAPVIPSTEAYLVSGYDKVIWDTTDGDLHDGDCYVSNDQTYWVKIIEKPDRQIITATGTQLYPASTEYEQHPGVFTTGCKVRKSKGMTYQAVYSDGTKTYTKQITKKDFEDLGKHNTEPRKDIEYQSVIEVLTP